MPTYLNQSYTVEQYNELERKTGLKHEWHAGRVYAMTGASARHNLLVANTIAAFHGQLRGSTCRIYPSDLRLYIEYAQLYTYPDA